MRLVCESDDCYRVGNTLEIDCYNAVQHNTISPVQGLTVDSSQLTFVHCANFKVT